MFIFIVSLLVLGFSPTIKVVSEPELSRSFTTVVSALCVTLTGISCRNEQI